jgi:hypothetical protein
MAETRQVGLGTLFKLDSTQGGTFVTHPLTDSVTPPPRNRARIDSLVLGDTLNVPLLGVEETSEFPVTYHWHPGETEHEKLDTLFGSKAEFDVQVVYPFATPVTDEFSVRCVELTPEAITPTGTIKRTATLLRTSAITRT